MTLDLRNLRCALTAADVGSIRRAADILGVPQSTVSRRIQHLERRLGFELFERRRTGVQTTRAGKEFLYGAGAGAQLIASAAQAAIALHQGRGGELKVGTSAMRAQRFLRDILRPFRAKFPNIGVSMIEGCSSDIHTAVAAGDLDLAFVIGVEEFPGCESRLLWREAVFIGLHESHSLTERAEIDWNHVQNEIFVTSKGGSGPDIREFLLSRLSRIDFRPLIEVHDISEAGVLEIVSAGHGMTLSCRSAARWWPDEIAFRTVRGEESTLSSRMIWLANNSNPALAHLRAMLDAERGQ
jgi:DNA-binding transcriptional LysR family regulator